MRGSWLEIDGATLQRKCNLQEKIFLNGASSTVDDPGMDQVVYCSSRAAPIQQSLIPQVSQTFKKKILHIANTLNRFHKTYLCPQQPIRLYLRGELGDGSAPLLSLPRTTHAVIPGPPDIGCNVAQTRTHYKTIAHGRGAPSEYQKAYLRLRFHSTPNCCS